MGFFQDLKQDISQAVNELAPEENKETKTSEASTMSTDEIFEESDEQLMGDLEAMLEKEVDSLDTTEKEDKIVTDEKTVEGIHENIPKEEISEEDFSEDTIPEEISTEELLKKQEEETAEKEEVEELLDEVENAIEQPEKEIPEVNTFPKEEKRSMMSSISQKDLSSETAVITEGMTITGDISGNGSMDIYGCINGNVDILGKLDVSGVINGNSSAAEVYADAAQINGEIKSKGSVKIGRSSVIIGNIEANSAVIAGAVKGDIDIHGPVILDSSAIVMGNIKSKSVQINNGAVIEGMCSQCYADVSPASFFNEVKKNKK